MNTIAISEFHTLLTKANLMPSLTQYKRVNDKISEMIKSEELIQVIKGKYISGKAFQQGEVSLFQIANALYGPSYVSTYTVLSYLGWIPERTFSIESVTTRKSKNYATEIGRFEYHKVRTETFAIGIQYVKDGQNAHLVASPTKALIDLLWLHPFYGDTSIDSLTKFLFENLRIDEFEFAKLDLDIVDECLQHGQKRRVLQNLKNVYNLIAHA